MTTPGRLLCAAALPCLLFASAVSAAEWTRYGALTTDYVFRGVSYSDSHAAVQAGVDVALPSGLYLGLWGSSADISGGATRQRDLQVNYYVGYNHDLGSAWSIGANVVAYSFPGTEGNIDYDFLEYSAVANFDDRAWLEYSHSPDLFHTGRRTHNVDLYGEWPLPRQLVLGAGAGYYDVSDLTGSGYAWWQLGITRAFGRIDVDLRYHDTSRAVPIISTPELAKARLALSVKISY
ncbi:MAG: TorF family putative porin [Woeseia sp.]